MQVTYWLGEPRSLPIAERVARSIVIRGAANSRFDRLFYPGYTIPPFYDSLLGKLIV
jgi:biotin carboxylase